MSDVTRILQAIDTGDARAAEQLFPLVYDELHQLAAARMSRESPDHTLQPTALVHEAYLRLVGPTEQRWESRGHFFAAAAEAMRRILVDSARRRAALKRGGDREEVALDVSQFPARHSPDEVIAVEFWLGSEQELRTQFNQASRGRSTSVMIVAEGLNTEHTVQFEFLGRADRLIFPDGMYQATDSVQTIVVAPDGRTRLLAESEADPSIRIR